jgi:pyruvate,orthophosphate dikinase
MFYGKGSEKPLFLLRKMILSANETERRKALDELFAHLLKKDMKATMAAMDGLTCNIQASRSPSS